MFRFNRDAFKQRPAHAFAETRQIRFQDVDAAGIIFYSRLFELCHDLWARFLAASGCPLPQLLADRSLVLPIRHAEADYFRPLRFGDDIEVALIATHLEESEVT